MSQTKIKNKTQHIPVLLQEVLHSLNPSEGESYVDMTAGYGGHASAIIEKTNGKAYLIDRDENAQAVLRGIFSSKKNVELYHLSFLEACQQFVSEGRHFDMILADLGVSSPHLDNTHRGFSLLAEAKLDMRMDPRQEKSAYDVVNSYSEEQLTKILREYGEEPKARQMARSIVMARPITTTLELAAVAKKVWPGHSRSHPATRLFQAVRIEVNNELGQIEEALPLAVKLLKPSGRLAIITFHSLEDRIVKRFFKQMAGDRYDAELVEVTNGPIVASEDELVYNPRARSAKLRVVRKRK